MSWRGCSTRPTRRSLAARDSASAYLSRSTASRATAVRSKRPPRRVLAPRSPSCPPEGTSMKILVDDDDAVLRNELADLLREDGHDVVGASDGGVPISTEIRPDRDRGREASNPRGARPHRPCRDIRERGHRAGHEPSRTVSDRVALVDAVARRLSARSQLAPLRWA